ncbi:MAG: hypothetical protein IT438_03595 [Phycisphaerales bacterium]|nr:hypothetical protein [Phycisphaerales bacterium]
MPVVRIVPPFRLRGIRPLALAVAICWGPVLIHAGDRLEHVFSMSPRRYVGFIMAIVAIAILPHAVLSVWFARLSRRIRPLLVTTMLMGAAMLASMVVYSQLFMFHAGALSHGFWHWSIIIPLAIFTLLGGSAGLLFRWLTRLLVEPVEQDGLMCWRCGYNIGAASLRICPECAEPADPSRFRRRWIARAWSNACRAGPIFLAVVLTIGLGWCAYRLGVVRPPYARFIERMADTRDNIHQWCYIRSGQQNYEWDGLLAQQPLADGTDRVIAYAYWPRGVGEAGRADIRMRIFLGEKRTHSFTMQSGGTSKLETMMVKPTEGSVRIFADLTGAQAEQVIRDGHAPDSLILALLDAADKHNWKGGSTTLWGPTYGAEEVAIDPQQHFQGANPAGHAPRLESDSDEGR